jgi:hypothetical protein
MQFINEMFMHFHFYIPISLAFLLLSCWSWILVCSPDIFSWNFSLCLINMAQVFYIIYNLRPVNLPEELLAIYGTLFEPLKVSRLA